MRFVIDVRHWVISVYLLSATTKSYSMCFSHLQTHTVLYSYLQRTYHRLCLDESNDAVDTDDVWECFICSKTSETPSTGPIRSMPKLLDAIAALDVHNVFQEAPTWLVCAY